jgi:4-hydroxy-3-methylbut-2-enyl diphosphate reductase
MTKPELKLYLAAPRGFCAGVDRAIKIVEMALKKWGAPVFVRHEIVHNKFVVDSLRAQGAIFVQELDECPDDRPVIFSAHGVPKSVPSAAQARNMIYVDATCPLVSKVHIEAERHSENGLANDHDWPRRPSRNNRHNGAIAPWRSAVGGKRSGC